MTLTRKTGTYYIEGLSIKSFKRVYSKNFKSLNEAVKEARLRQKKGKIHQADIMFSKNIISDEKLWSLDTTGKVKRYNPEKRIFEEYRR